VRFPRAGATSDRERDRCGSVDRSAVVIVARCRVVVVVVVVVVVGIVIVVAVVIVAVAIAVVIVDRCRAGLYTGALYNDSGLRTSGFTGEGVSDRSVVAIKSHLGAAVMAYTGQHPLTRRKAANPVPFDFDKCVVLMRHPLSALVSERKRRVSVRLAGVLALNAPVNRSATTNTTLRRAAQVSTPTWEQFQRHANSAWEQWTENEISQWVRGRRHTAVVIVPVPVPVCVRMCVCVCVRVCACACVSMCVMALASSVCGRDCRLAPTTSRRRWKRRA
jgi:hypothetical protein